MTVQWDDLAARGRAHTRVVLDTGATENAVGIDSLQYVAVIFQSSNLEMDIGMGSGSPSSRSSQYFPWTGFILCSGRHRSYDTTFARSTYFEIQSKALWFHMTMACSYIALVLVTFMPYKCRHCSLGHITIDLAEKPMILDVSNVFQAVWFQGLDFKGMSGCSDVSDAAFYRDESKIERIYMMEAEAEPPMRSMQQLARRLKNLQGAIEGRERGTEVFNGYPCYQAHKPGNHRDNQHASWVTCTRCGLRLQYFTKGRDGSFRQMGPEPHLIGLASKELEQTVDASMVTSNIVTGKTMEIKGKMLQMRVSTPVAINMTFPEYIKRLEMFGPADQPKTSVTKWHLWRNQSSRCWLRTWLPQQGDIKWGPKEDGGSQEEWKRTWTCSEGREDIPGEVSIDFRSDGNRFERRGGHRGEEERSRGVIWAALRDLRNRMSRKGTSDGAGQDHSMIHTLQNQNENDTTITADSGQSPSSQVDINPQSTCTCTTDGTVCSISRQANLWKARLPTQDPNNKVGSNLAVKLSRNAALIGAMVLAPVSGLLGQLQGVPDFVEIACAPKTLSASAFEANGYFIKRVNMLRVMT